MNTIINICTKHFSILKSLTLKSFKGRYAAHFFGIWWILIVPLLMAVLIDFIFSRVLNIQIEHFALFVLCAMMPWMFFSRAISESTASFIQAKQVLNQFQIPKQLIPTSCVVANFMSFSIGIFVIIPVFMIMLGHISWVLLLLFVVMGLHLVFTIGLALLCSVLAVFFRDLEEIIGVIFMFWFWVTPIFYSITMVPQRFVRFFWFNPIAIFCQAYRDIMFHMKAPDISSFMYMGIVSIGICVIAWVVFKRVERGIVKRI